MSLDKAIKHGKERRKPYYGSENFDVTCRPHGGTNPTQQCPYCLRNRTVWRLRLRAAVEANVEEWMDEEHSPEPGRGG